MSSFIFIYGCNKLIYIEDNGVRDRAYIFVNEERRGILTRLDAIWSLPLDNVYPGDTLQILVENQGRIGFAEGNVDFKGYLISMMSIYNTVL